MNFKNIQDSTSLQLLPHIAYSANKRKDKHALISTGVSKALSSIMAALVIRTRLKCSLKSLVNSTSISVAENHNSKLVPNSFCD